VFVALVEGVCNEPAEHGDVVERPGADKCEKGANILEFVLDGRASKAPARLCRQPGDSFIEQSAFPANHMSCKEISRSKQAPMLTFRTFVQHNTIKVNPVKTAVMLLSLLMLKVSDQSVVCREDDIGGLELIL
jgi:hypothetical protein